MVDGAPGDRRAGRVALPRRARHAATTETDEAWAFLRHYVERADAFVFSRAEYVPEWMDRDRVVVIPPSIDPFSAKNRELDRTTVRRRSWRPSAWSPAPRPSGPVSLPTPRRLAGHGPATTPASSPTGRRRPTDARLIVQVSRWDRLKDMAGVLTGFIRMAADGPADAHLVLVGPDVSGVTDDPEGAAVLAECRARWREPCPSRCAAASTSPPSRWTTSTRTPSSSTPCSVTPYVVVQKSLVEGFGLTVTEAMWKARPVIASRVGGIQDQIADERDGLLIADPSDLDALAAADGPPLATTASSPTGSARPREHACRTSSSGTATSPSTSTSSSASAPRPDSPNAMRPRLGVPPGRDSRPTSSRCRRRPGAAGHQVLFFPPARDRMPRSRSGARALQKGAAPLGFAYTVGRPGPLTLGARTGCPYCERPSGAPCSGRTQEADR